MNQQQLNEVAVGDKYSLYIPRASLSSASSSGLSSKSSSRSREFLPNPMDIKRNRSNSKSADEISEESELEGVYNGSSIDEKKSYRDNKTSHPMYIVRKTDIQSSSSSSSSSASNQSNYSVNSLLLSVKNLENFNKTLDQQSRKHHHHHHRIRMPAKMITEYSDHNPNIILKSNYYLNYFINQEAANRFPLYEHRWKMLQNIRNITMYDDNNIPSISINHDKETEADKLSTTSSTTTTNFTVISLNDSSQRLNKSKKAICRRSHTISILIFVMTTIFVIFISVMLFLMDMRNQKMPR